MDILLIIGAIFLFFYKFFNEGVKTSEQIDWERSMKETRKNLEEHQKKYRELYNKDK